MSEPPKYAAVELERRWLVPLETARGLAFERRRTIEDLYLIGTRLRLRAVREEGREAIFKLGKKYESSSPGEEPVVSVYLDPAEHALLSRLPGHRAMKERRSVAGGSLDVYQSPAHPFAIFEVEFDSRAQAHAYRPPPFVGLEVTGDDLHSGFRLAAAASVAPA